MLSVEVMPLVTVIALIAGLVIGAVFGALIMAVGMDEERNDKDEHSEFY